MNQRAFTFAAALFFAANAVSQAATVTNSVAVSGSTSPDVAFSLLRVVGAMVLVIAVFLGGVWLLRNWQRLAVNKGRAPKLNLLETKSLGNRQAIFVVGYEQQRFLVGSSANGLTLLTHLPPSDSVPDADAPVHASFADTLVRAVTRKP
jgi:flagellar biogenesis protein FliO